MKLELVADTAARATVHVVWISKLSVLSFSVFFMENLEVLHSYFVHFKEKFIIKYFFLRGEKLTSSSGHKESTVTSKKFFMQKRKIFK